MENIEKNIAKVSLITFGILIGLTAIITAIVSIFFPKPMHELCEKLGFENLAYTFAESQYNKSNDINDLHTLLYSAYKIKNNNAIIKYSEKMFAREDYEEFILYINALNKKNANLEIAQIVMSNENNYLKNQYVKALCEYDCFDKALDFAKNELLIYQTWQSSTRTEWLLVPLLQQDKTESQNQFSFLNNILPQKNKSMIYLIENYLDEIIIQYNLLKGNENLNANDTFIMKALNYDLVNYLSNILYLENKTTLSKHDFSYYKDIKKNL